MKIATCWLHRRGQKDLSLLKGYKKRKNFLQEFFGAMQVQSSLAKWFFFIELLNFILILKMKKSIDLFFVISSF